MKKVVSILLLSILILGGCANSTNTESTGDGVLTVWGFFEGAPKLALDYYAEQTGTEVEYTSIGWDDYQTKLNTVVGTKDAPDIVLLERTFMGTYLQSDNFLVIEDLMEGEQSMADYKENTALATQGPGVIDNKVKAIGWENTASAFFYRSDLASKCLDINSVEEMEAATQTFDDYKTLYDKLQSSSDETCSNMAMFSYPDYQTGLLQNIGAYRLQDDGSYMIPKEIDSTFDEIKEENNNGMVYSPQSDKTQIVSGNQNDVFLGTISPAWAMQAVLEYEQPGQWAVADTPLDYTAGGTYMAVTSNADQNLVKDFLNMTFLNEQWLIDNMDEFGMVGNEKIMNKYLETTDGSNEYFSGQNTVKKFAQINDNITTYDPVTVYDNGIGTSLKEVQTGYTVDNTIATTQEAKEQLKSKINGLYPDLNVIIEE